MSLTLCMLLAACGGEDSGGAETAGSVVIAPGAGAGAVTPAAPPPAPTPAPAPAPAPAPTPSTSPAAATPAPGATPTPSPAPAPSAALENSFYVGNDPNQIGVVERWLARKPDAVQLHIGRAGWSDWRSSSGWMAGLFAGRGVDIRWSVPLIATGATLEQAAAGAYDEHYRDQARTLNRATPAGKKIPVRIGWEFNADWQPWAAIKNPEAYKGAFRKVVDIFRQETDRFEFEWTPNIGDHGMDPALAYPGDGYVDVIGMDFYYNTQWHPKDPEAAWIYMVNEKYGLAWHQQFAAARKKPTAYAEWGVDADTSGPFIKRAKQWFVTHKVQYHSYWDSNADFKGMLSNNQFPRAAQDFKEAFGN
ncbi:glycoside hydrolase family 26 protein [Sphingomonas qomolangmaensis]|uniref:Glycosyl hydrolase n=1 Tax=Sphingomonas qomolangmaensis TaxID=2918765 RepID=A0ABY5L7U9_9SPHN|nr:glycosyl hydrolase [Sphingomonas qomolangmaensis]UUL82872.1 glycosyl hydrolase [Sphingomonas qomolangmaensis]